MDFYDGGLIGFAIELSQTLPQFVSFHTNDGMLTGIVVRQTLEDPNAYYPLFKLVKPAVERAGM